MLCTHRDTLVEVIRGLSNPMHPAGIHDKKSLSKSLCGKIPVHVDVSKQSHTRLDQQQIEDLVATYPLARTIKEVTAQFHVHHTNVHS